MKYFVYLVIFITLCVGAEIFSQHWLRKNSLSYLIQNYPSEFDGVPKISKQVSFPGRTGVIATDDYGFVGNKMEDYGKENNIGFFGGWSGMGIGHNMAQNLPVLISHFLKAPWTPELYKNLTVFNFSEGGHCIESLEKRITDVSREYKLERAIVFITADLFLPCAQSNKEFNEELSKYAFYYFYRKLTGKADEWSPQVTLRKVLDSERLEEVRPHLSRLRSELSVELDMDIVPLVFGNPGAPEKTDFELLVNNELFALGFEPIPLSVMEGYLPVESVYQNIFMPTMERALPLSEQIVRRMMKRGVR